MKRYPELLSGDITLQDLTDSELKQLRKGWGYILPEERFWTGAFKELRRREIERATKPKPIIRDFF